VIDNGGVAAERFISHVCGEKRMSGGNQTRLLRPVIGISEYSLWP
jgi:hypothetical protein